MKVGPELSPGELVELIDLLNPENEAGRLTLITRFGRDKIQQGLPPLVEAVQDTGKIVLWCSDPMHGNTIRTGEGLKTRPSNTSCKNSN